MKCRDPWRRTTSGQTLVEFALTLPVFLVMLLAMIDFGLGVYAYNTVSYAAQEGMRRGIVLGKDCGAYMVVGNKQNFSGAGTPTYSDGVAANTNDATNGLQSFTTSAITSPIICPGNSTSRPTILGAVNGALGILDRSNARVIIEKAPGGTSGARLPAAGEDVTVRVMYRHRAIWGFVLDGLAALSQSRFDITMNTAATGQIQ